MSDNCQNEESDNELEERVAVIPPPKDAAGYGEMGKPVLLNVTIILFIYFFHQIYCIDKYVDNYTIIFLFFFSFNIEYFK